MATCVELHEDDKEGVEGSTVHHMSGRKEHMSLLPPPTQGPYATVAPAPMSLLPTQGPHVTVAPAPMSLLPTQGPHVTVANAGSPCHCCQPRAPRLAIQHGHINICLSCGSGK